MADVTDIEQLQAEVEQMTDEVDTLLFGLWKKMFDRGDIKGIGSFLYKIRSSLTVSSDVVDIEAKLRKIILKQFSLQQMLHHQCLIDDNYCDDIINRCCPHQSDTSKKILDVVKLVTDKIGCQYPMFTCYLVGAGSCSDGTKIDKLNEMDFIFILKYNSKRDYNLIIKEDLFGYLHCVITPSIDSDLHHYCRDDETLDVKHFRDDFEDALSHVIQESCHEMRVNFGGFMRPNYSQFRKNGPAFTIKLEDISVDFTVSFHVPSHVMCEILHRKCRPDVLRYIKQYLGRYSSLGLVVVTDYGDEGRLQLSTNLLERNLIRHNHVIRQTLIVMKYYKDHLLNVFHPSLVYYYKRVIKTVRDDIIHVIDEDGNLLEKYNKYLMGVKKSRDKLERVMILYQAVTSLKQEENTSSLLCQQLAEIEQQCRRIIFNLMEKHINIDPSLSDIIDEEVKPLIRTPSYILKLMIIKEYFNNIEMTPEMTPSQSVKSTLVKYRQHLIEGQAGQLKGDTNTMHPFLGESLELTKISDWRRDDIIYNDYRQHVMNIVDRATRGVTETLRVTNTPTVTDTPRMVDRDNGGVYILMKSFYVKIKFTYGSSMDLDQYIDTSYLNVIVDICYLDNNNLIVLTRGGLQIITKDGDKVNHPLLDGRDKITVFNIEEDEERRLYMWRIMLEECSRLMDKGRLSDEWWTVINKLGRFTCVSVNKKEDIIVVIEMRRYDQGYLNVWNLVSNNWQFNRYKICDDPWCVDITSNGQYVVGGINGLYKYNKSCKIIWRNRSYHVVRLTVNNNNDNIVIIDRRNRVFVIDSGGDFLLSISPTSDSLLKPQGLSVDNEGNLLICDDESKSILLFNNRYQFVRKLITTSYSPDHVALCNNKCLAICFEDSDVVNIYCIDDNNESNEI
ncbi:hypothetical protein LSH36_579g04022 [Paralvinella palmiformis]|uniref:Uncharacterized protein n=1 Tax=Paralvinella palmiformis TaxID=53620 RepID=A0AAD9J5Q6_9ANNE|nr:hypothetical protein LSH36_579g04022 [Paralvinella palmiformis]